MTMRDVLFAHIVAHSEPLWTIPDDPFPNPWFPAGPLQQNTGPWWVSVPLDAPGAGVDRIYASGFLPAERSAGETLSVPTELTDEGWSSWYAREPSYGVPSTLVDRVRSAFGLWLTGSGVRAWAHWSQQRTELIEAAKQSLSRSFDGFTFGRDGRRNATVNGSGRNGVRKLRKSQNDLPGTETGRNGPPVRNRKRSKSGG